MPLTKEQLQRYARNIIISEIGEPGQAKLLKTKVLIVGLGGLGSPCAYYLAAAGVGRIGLVDFDLVDLDNLQRQILYTVEDIGKLKVESAKEKLNKLNPEIEVIAYKEKLLPANVLNIIKDFDLVVECSDNFATKYLLNDACVLSNKSFFYAAVTRFEGQVMSIVPGESACLRCAFPHPPGQGKFLSPKESGILGSVAGTIGLMQTNEVLKYILGIGELLLNNFLIFNILFLSFDKVKISKDIKCPVCGQNPIIKDITDSKEIL